ncbi:hypothetical protein KQI84_04845 [bacterium]|nr:hypothetical protein [bacterium]
MNSETRKSWGGLLLLLAVVMPVDLYRISIQQSFWIDEVYSVLMANLPLRQMIEMTAADRHPPGFYLLLKGWLALGDTLGSEPSVFYGRLLNSVLLAIFGAIVWFGGRRLLGRSAGTAAAWCLVGSAQVLQSAKDIRGYLIGIVMVTTCFLLMMILDSREPDDRRTERLWVLYGLAAIAAMWTHFFPSLVIGMLGILWLVRTISKKRWKTRWFHWGLGVQVVALLVFLPWLVVIRHQLRSLSQGTDWMTPATWVNLWHVFSFWYPLGRLNADAPWSSNWPMFIVGILTLVVPLALAAMGVICGRSRNGTSPLLATAVAGILMTIVNVLIQWGVDYLEIAPIFHGPRYPVFTIGPWIIGLVALGAWGIARLGGRQVWVWIVVIPWVGAAVLGQTQKTQIELKEGGLYTWRQESAWLFPPAGEAIYMMPEEMIPYMKPALKDFDVHPIDDLAELPDSVTDVTIVRASIWMDIERLNEGLLRSSAESGDLAEKTDMGDFPRFAEEYSVYRLRGIKHSLARSLAEGNPLSRQVPDDAIAVATPEAQSAFDGWSGLEGNSQAVFRWGVDGPVRIRFDKPVPAGRYKLTIAMYRPPYPEETVTFGISVPKESTKWKQEIGSGASDRTFEIEFKKSHEQLILELDHPTWVPRDSMEDSDDERMLTFLFSGAWLQPTD